MRGLHGRCVVVTGGASGIGRAIAERLASEGASVGVWDINASAAEAVAGAIRSAGGNATPCAVDITDHDRVRDAVRQFEQSVGAIAGLVNCAGWDRMARFVDTDPQLWRKVVDINLFGALNVLHAVLPEMVSRKFGRIVNIASDAGRVGSSGEAVYSACKGGLIALAKTLAREHIADGIVINTVCPGPTETPLLAQMAKDGGLGERIVPKLERAMPMRRLAQPDDYPGAVAFLLSDDAAYITGQTLSVSGGLTMHG
jgi:2-hydroxycyclohexanecarboxyl-CoA dehydrogenase